MRFPRVACYARCRTSGLPYINEDGSLNMNLLKALSRYSVITLDIAPWYSVDGSMKPEAILLLRRWNPTIKILGYSLLTYWYRPADYVPPLTDLTFPASWHRAIIETNGFIPNPVSGYEVNWEKRETADTLTDLLCSVASSKLFDGFFGDYFSPIIDWVSSTHPNYTAEGDVQRVINMQRLVRHLRKAGGPGFLVCGNGVGLDRIDIDGTFREGFPNPLTNFEQARKWAQDSELSYDWLQAGGGITNPETPDARRSARFALGTSCLLGTLCSFGPNRDITYPYAEWWQPEYDQNGITGWLGEPTGNIEDLGNNIWRRKFDNGSVLVNNSNVTFLYEEKGSISLDPYDAIFFQEK